MLEQKTETKIIQGKQDMSWQVLRYHYYYYIIINIIILYNYIALK